MTSKVEIKKSKVEINRELKERALKDLPPGEFPSESTMDSMRCQAPYEWDDRIKYALLQSDNADYWRPYFPDAENAEIERYKNENAQLLEQAVEIDVPNCVVC
jgi:hypothetical protein